MITKIENNLYVGPAETLDRDHAFGVIEAFVDVRTCFHEEEKDPNTGVSTWKVKWKRLGYMVDSISYLTADRDIPTLVFCHGGIDRSPFVVACVLQDYHRPDMSINEAYDYVKELRPEINIHYEWIAGWRERFDRP